MRVILRTRARAVVGPRDGVAELAGAVLKQAVLDRDARFFADGPDLQFWCHCARVRVEAVQACFRRTHADATLID